MLTAIAFVYLTASSPFPIRECSTDGDCEMAVYELGCEEYDNIRKPKLLYKCDKVIYEHMVKARKLDPKYRATPMYDGK